MSRETKRNSLRHYLVYLAVIAALVFLTLDPTGWMGWVILAGLAGAFAVHVHRTSGIWLETIGQEVSSLDDRPIPAEFEDRLQPLMELGFSRPLWWVIDGEVGATLLSSDGSVSARTAEGDAERSPILTTDWPDAVVRTSRGLGIPIKSNDYIQILPQLDIQELFEAHREAVGILGRRYGQSVRREQLTIEMVNEGIRRRHDWLNRHRYLRTAKAMALWYANVGYRTRLARQIGLTTSVWSVWLFFVLTWIIIGWFWVSAVSEQSAPLFGLARYITLLAGGFSIAGIASLRKRRRFSRQPSTDS